MQRGRARAARGLLLGCLLGVLQAAETLEVKMDVQVMAFLNSDVLLLCNISRYNTPELDIKKMAAIWYLKTTGGNERRKVYSVVAGEHTSYRNGSQMDEKSLKKGSAALFLPQIQLNESGKYICDVAVTPSKAEGTTILEIVAKPAVILSPEKLTIERDKEKTISCAVNKFYPDSIVVQWQKNSKLTSDKSVPAEDICTGTFVVNEDGTFNITSKLKLQPSLQDDGNLYSCIVKHKSFSMEKVFSVTLTVTEPKENVVWVPALLIITVLIFVIAVFVVYHWRCKTLPPVTMEFIGPEELKHLEETQLQCLFSGFRPKPLEVVFFLTTRPDNEKKKIFSWNTEALSNPEQSDESLPLLMKKQYIHFDLSLHAQKRGTFDVSCKICIVPDVRELHKFDLSLEIRHKAFPHGLLVKEKSFKVVALPLLDQIQCSTDTPQPEELLTLTCRIHSYFPEALEILWYKDDEKLPEQPFVTHPTKGSDGLFSCISSILYRLKEGDVRKRFFCKANLKGSQECKTSTWKMKDRAPPVLDQVQCSTDEPSSGTPLHIYCRIHSFCPQAIEVHWYKDGDPIPDKPFVSEPTEGPDGLFSCITSIVYLPKAGDVGRKFFCKASLKGLQECEESVWEMKNLVFIPKVSQIECEPSEPELGKPITLSCVVQDFYPPECDICWKKGLEELTYAKTENPEWDPASNLYHRKSQVSFTPNPEDHAVDFVVEIKHRSRSKQSIYPLILKGFPRVTDIFLHPSHAEYGNTLSLTCEVMDFCPQEIRIQWLDGDNLISTGVVTEEPVKDSNGSFKLSSRFQMVPTALDYDKTISFMVTHKKLTKPITKSISLKLPAIPPDVSEIVLSQHGDITFLEISVSNFAPRDIQVVWYKGWKKLSEDVNPSNICTGENKLCCLTSRIQFCLKAKDTKKSFGCMVFHPATKTVQEKNFILNIGSRSRMQSNPVSSECRILDTRDRWDQESNFSEGQSPASFGTSYSPAPIDQRKNRMIVKQNSWTAPF
ncbi:uncharacterized protein [Tiliqua scincoides]|uniref:uncharacterized protein n=1 Tax=Tiliqua scincoides TaxID=71010 RepID=UPI0034619033